MDDISSNNIETLMEQSVLEICRMTRDFSYVVVERVKKLYIIRENILKQFKILQPKAFPQIMFDVSAELGNVSGVGCEGLLCFLCGDNGQNVNLAHQLCDNSNRYEELRNVILRSPGYLQKILDGTPEISLNFFRRLPSEEKQNSYKKIISRDLEWSVSDYIIFLVLIPFFVFPAVIFRRYTNNIKRREQLDLCV
ncbi:MAG: hypothetical protein LBJ93_03310 [Clostridiales bacterium]|jgi:hypothetical protein|nr:hypothetical protein [Clostridiales bacterium]